MAGGEERLAAVTPLRPRRRTALGHLRRQAAFGLVASLVLSSLLAVALGAFRPGAVGLALAVLLAAAARAFLPQEYAGWLAVRSRVVDVTILSFLGVALLVFALVVPPPE